MKNKDRDLNERTVAKFWDRRKTPRIPIQEWNNDALEYYDGRHGFEVWNLRREETDRASRWAGE